MLGLHHFDVKVACPDLDLFALGWTPSTFPHRAWLGTVAQQQQKKKAAPSAVAAEEMGFPRLFYRNIGSRALFRVECIVVRGVVYFEKRAYTWNEIIRHMRGQISKFAAPLRCESHQLLYTPSISLES